MQTDDQNVLARTFCGNQNCLSDGACIFVQLPIFRYHKARHFYKRHKTHLSAAVKLLPLMSIQFSQVASKMLEIGDRKTALLALTLLVPAASIGAVTALYIAPGIWGQTLSVLCQVWLLVFPIAWSVLVDRQKLHFSLPKRRELLAGVLWGTFMFAAIVGIYSLFGQHWIDAAIAKEKAQQLGIGSANIYLIVEAYFVLVNSLIEEFTWRWFVCNKCHILMPGTKAIFLSSLFFTLHHIFVIAAYSDWRGVLLGSLAVFAAGIIWSQCYLTYRSLWSSYISHAIADLALAIIAWQILFN